MEPIPREVLDAANSKSRRLRELVRAPEILVMPGAYDVLSALLFEHMGFKAVQGTSGGIAAALGYPDGEAISRELFRAGGCRRRGGGNLFGHFDDQTRRRAKHFFASAQLRCEKQ